MEKIGVSILTNETRLEYLQVCLSSFLKTCYYRPLKMAVFNNGSTDKTHEWCKSNLKGGYAIEWVYDYSERDLGCAAGSNKASELVSDCKYVLHLESDFRAIPESLSGCDKHWLHRAVDFMETGVCDYLYLRRMMTEEDIRQHWWAQWFTKKLHQKDCYMECPNLWWSNNPHLRRNDAIYQAGCLPLNESIDGPKGTPGWCAPEMKTPRPHKPWIHKWGIFVHEAPPNNFLSQMTGCSISGCKYGFFKPYDGADLFCKCCNREKDFTDMQSHYERFLKEWRKINK